MPRCPHPAYRLVGLRPVFTAGRLSGVLCSCARCQRDLLVVDGRAVECVPSHVLEAAGAA